MLSMPDPIAFTIFNFEIRWYALLIGVALILGLLIALKRCVKYNIDPDLMYDAILWIVPLAVIGARLYYVFFEWDYYGAHLDKIIALWEGGLAIHGAIAGGLLGCFIFCKQKNINLLTLTDLLVPSLILGQAIGRWGNYFNMEAYGRQTTLPWAINVVDPVLGIIKVHPTFLYESILNFLIFLILIFVLEKKKKIDGQLTCYYFILYSIGRFFIEGLRTDSLMILGLRTAQIVSLLSILLGVIGLIYLNKKAKEIGKG